MSLWAKPFIKGRAYKTQEGRGKKMCAQVSAKETVAKTNPPESGMSENRFPETLPWGHLNQTGEYKLQESSGRDFAFYGKDVGFGFRHGLEINRLTDPKGAVEVFSVKTLSGNSFGKGTWLICREAYFATLEDTVGHLEGKQRVYKPKRKPETIRPLTDDQIKELVAKAEA